VHKMATVFPWYHIVTSVKAFYIHKLIVHTGQWCHNQLALTLFSNAGVTQV